MTEYTHGADRPETVIEPTDGWVALGLADLGDYWDLLVLLLKREIRSRYAQSILGVGWALFQPLAYMLVYTLVFSLLIQVPSDGAPYAIFVFSAIVPWTYFSTTLTASANSVVAASGMIKKVYFPRLLIPLSHIGAKALDFAISMVLLGGLMVFYGYPPTPKLLILPVLVVILGMTTLGMGLWFSALAVLYRDVNHALSLGVQVMMYSAPIIYPLSLVPASIVPFYSLNPLVGIVEGFRAAILGTRAIPWDAILIGGAMAAFIAITGLVYFRRMERYFADVV